MIRCNFNAFSVGMSILISIIKYFLVGVILSLASCNSTLSSPPVAEWNVQPSSRPKNTATSNTRGKGVSLQSSTAAPVIETGTGSFIGDGYSKDKETSSSGENSVTLNLVNLPVNDAAKIVIGEILGANYIVDPKVDSKITVHTAAPVNKTTALSLFQSALKVSGVSVVKSANIYKIVPIDQAVTSGETITSGTSSPEATPFGSTAQVVQLKYVSALEMKRVLEPIAERGSIVRADDARNTLTLSGSPQDISVLRDAISMFDIDTMRGMSFALVPVKSGDADVLAEDLKNIFGSEKEGPMNGMIRFIGNKKLASVLVISSQPQYLSRAQAWIQRLDARAEHSEKQFFTYRVQNRPAKELLNTLGSIFGTEKASDLSAAPRFGSSGQSSSSNSLGQSGQATSSPLGALSAAGPTSGGAPSNGTSSGAASNGGPLGTSIGSGSAGAAGLTAGLSVPGPQNNTNSGGATPSVSMDQGRYRIGVDDAKNALVVMATPDDFRRLQQVVQTLDVMPNQVLIEATIAEVQLNDAIRFGVRWFIQNQSNLGAFGGTGGTVGPNTNYGTNTIGAGLGANFPGFSYALRAINQQVTVNALNQITEVNILSTPSLTVLDNREAFLQVGDQVPVQTLSTTTAIGSVFNSVTYANTGVILKITPHISDSGRLMLDLEQEVSNVKLQPDGSASTTTPTIAQRRVKTQVVVNDSETLLLGGLVQDQRDRLSNQIPVVGDIPLFGNAFKDKVDAVQKRELVIMITPHIMRSVDDGREITEEYKRKLLDISSRTIAQPHDIEQSARRTVFDPYSHSPWRVDKDSR